MSRSLSGHIFIIDRYLRFLRHSITRYKVHSPYVYRLITEVIRPGAPSAVCGPVESLRADYLRSNEHIIKTDLGAGGLSTAPSRYPARLAGIARHSTTPAYRAARLFYLARFLQAETVLELGTALGLTTAYIAKARPEAHIVTLEGCPELAALSVNNFKSLGLENVKVLQGDFESTLPEALSILGRTDLVFFDGNHRLEPTLRYFEACLHSAGPGTVFVFDDIHQSPGMEAAWDRMRNHARVTVSIDLFHMGMLFFSKELSHQHFILRYP